MLELDDAMVGALIALAGCLCFLAAALWLAQHCGRRTETHDRLTDMPLLVQSVNTLQASWLTLRLARIFGERVDHRFRHGSTSSVTVYRRHGKGYLIDMRSRDEEDVT